jgi:uncharacterized protein YigE (DUF2233 family)
MKNGKTILMVSTLFAFILFCSYTNEQKNPTEQQKINIDAYNALNYSIDSIGGEINRHQREINSATNEIEKSKKEKSALKSECEEAKKVPRTDTSKAKIDSLSKPNNNCEGLSEKLKTFDKTISKLEAEIEKQNLVIKKLEIGQSSIKEQLKAEIKNINKNVKTLDGSFLLRFKGVDYNIFISNSDSDAIKMHLLNKDGRNYASIRNLQNYLISQKLTPLMITNAGMYTHNLQPQGLFIENRKEQRPIDLSSPKTDANFYLKPNGVFYIDTLGKSHIAASQEFQKLYESKSISVEFATQSGPMLVSDGEIHDAFKAGSQNRKIRSGVGIIDSKKTVFAISLDEANFYDFAILFRDIFGCKDALFLDGAISLMYLKDIAPNTLGGQFGPLISVTDK